jgi:hypothetical protein
MKSKKPHPLTGRKKSPEAVAKMKATKAEQKRLREAGTTQGIHFRGIPEKRKYTKRKIATVVIRSPEQLMRDVKEALWCIDRAVSKTRSKIASGELSLTDVSDEETFLYMAKRYLEGGLKP